MYTMYSVGSQEFYLVILQHYIILPKDKTHLAYIWAFAMKNKKKIQVFKKCILSFAYENIKWRQFLF